MKSISKSIDKNFYEMKKIFGEGLLCFYDYFYFLNSRIIKKIMRSIEDEINR